MGKLPRAIIKASAVGVCAAFGSITWAEGDYVPAIFAFVTAMGVLLDFALSHEGAE